MILWFCLKLATGCVDSEVCWEGLCVGQGALPKATWYELQSDLQVVALVLGLRCLGEAKL